MATSAAPAFFPRHCFNNGQYVDGGVYANAPGLMALHEAKQFLQQEEQHVRLLAIGTMSSTPSVDPSKNRSGGMLDWGGGSPKQMAVRLFAMSISAQEEMTDAIVKHRLGDRYLRIDDKPGDGLSKLVSLTNTDSNAKELLLSAAIERSKKSLGDQKFTTFLNHKASTHDFRVPANTI
jgi:uncharacterized protein